MTKLTASDAQELDFFGESVALSGDTAVVGAFQEDAGGSNAGAAYVFRRDLGGADNWGEDKKLIATDGEAGDEFGRSVAFSGDTAVMGARLAGAGDVGAAYVFDLSLSKSTPTPPPTDTPTPTHTATPAPPTPIGGIGVFPGVPGATADAGGPAVLTWLAAAVVAGAIALGGAAWYTRRRWR